MGNLKITIDEINKLDPLDIATNDKVKAKFIQIYNTVMNGVGNAEAAYEKESIYFNRILSENEHMRNTATKFSIFTAFLDLAVCGLSLEQGSRALCYLQGRNFKIGQDEKGRPIYEGRLVLNISGYGELVKRERDGQIKHADNPVLVYEEDEFHFTAPDGQKLVKYECKLPHKSNHIVAVFMMITRKDGSIDYAVLFEEDWQRLQNYSQENNKKWDRDSRSWIKGKANDLYTSNNGGIDPGFLIAKCIKHAFKSYPKVPIGRGTELESQQVELQIDDDLYGIDSEASEPNTDCKPDDISTGVVIDNTKGSETEDDDAF